VSRDILKKRELCKKRSEIKFAPLIKVDMKKTRILICIFLGIILISFTEKGNFYIEISNSKTLLYILAQKEFSLYYIHSSEREPWENIFVVNDDETFTLKTIKVRSLGPGVPYCAEPHWKFEIADGYFIYDNVNQNFDSLNIKLSKISPHFIIVGDKTYNLVDLCGDNADIEIKIKRGSNMRRFMAWRMRRFKKL